MTAEALLGSADAEHLTDALRRSGVLGRGRVCNVDVEHAYPAILSRVLRLCLTYEAADGAVPGSVIFKTGLPRRTSDIHTAGRQEVASMARSRRSRRRVSCRVASTPLGMRKPKPGTSYSRI